jgi:hypothetical protein
MICKFTGVQIHIYLNLFKFTQVNNLVGINMEFLQDQILVTKVVSIFYKVQSNITLIINIFT